MSSSSTAIQDVQPHPTWQRLEAVLGEVSWQEYDYARYERVLAAAFQNGSGSTRRLTSSRRRGSASPGSMPTTCALLELMMSTGVAEKVRSAGSLRAAFEVLRSYPAIGDFLAYQYVIDLNYSPVLEYDEMELSFQVLVHGTASASASGGRRTGSGRRHPLYG